MNEPRIWQYRELLKNLIIREMKLRYCASFLGLLWTLLIPLATIIVYWIAFEYILKVAVENFVVFFTIGILPYNFFNNSITASISSVISNANLIKKIHFPRMILPLATVLYFFLLFLIALGVFFLFVLLTGTKLGWSLLAYPLVLSLQLMFTIGAALLISSLTVFYRDMQQIIEVALMMLFWATPIVYAPSSLPEQIRILLVLNPLACYIMAYQDIIYSGIFPSIATWMLCFFWAAFMLLLGSGVFRHYDPSFAEEL